MAGTDAIDEIIDTAAAEPQAASVDGESVTNRSLKELNEHRQTVANRNALRGNKSGWAFTRPARFQPPGGAE